MTMMLLEFDQENKSDVDSRLSFMQSQIDDAIESMGKVRRKVFAEVTSVRKKLTELETENAYLKQTLKGWNHGKSAQWAYEQEGYLFDVLEFKEA